MSFKVNTIYALHAERLVAPAHPIPQLELLDEMVARAKYQSIAPLLGVAIIAVQHKLETTATLFKAIIDLGVDPNSIFLSGKCYSTSKSVEQSIRQLGLQVFPDAIPQFPGDYQRACTESLESMWEFFMQYVKQKESIKKILVLDDGGRLIELMPHYVPFSYAVAAIEQTRGGLYSKAIGQILYPIIAVASCAVKVWIEPPLIADAILKRLDHALEFLKKDKNIVCGIVGNGAIGAAIADYLLSNNFTVLVYDPDPKSFAKVSKRIFRVSNISNIFASVDCVFGCTGKDITAGLPLIELVRRNQIWVSATSEDKEFRSFLMEHKDRAQTAGLLADVIFTTHLGAKITVKSWGYPFNFDQKPWNVPAKDIEITQACLLGSIIQAFLIAGSPVDDGITINRAVMYTLDPRLQQFIALTWGSRKENTGRYPLGFFDRFKNITWIRQHSGGEQDEKSQTVAQCFENSPSSVPPSTTLTPLRAKL